MHFLILMILLNFPLFAQQPEKESSADLRNGMVMFSIEDLQEDTSYWLERTSNLDFVIHMKDDDKEKIQKVSSQEAKMLDMEFASTFLKCQYELPPSAENCKVTLRLSMKGEGQDICGKDEKKAQEFATFLKSLAKRF